MTAATFKFKYAGAAFLVVLLAAVAVVVLLLIRDAADTRSLGVLAENAARERVDPELQARARSVAAHAADSIAGAVRAGDTAGMARRLQPFVEDETVAGLTVTDLAGRMLFSWQRGAPLTPGTLSAGASAPVRTLVENIPGAVTPETLATLTVALVQAAPVPQASLAGRLHAATVARTRLTLWLAFALAGAGALIGAALAWRTVNQLQRPVDSFIKSAERIGQGDYTRPFEVPRKRDALGDLQQALERMRGRLRVRRPSTRTTCTACSTA